MFYRSGDHRDLHVLTHSFPTRLSSDRDYKAPVTQTLDLGETAAVLPENVIPWPGSLPDQVSAVQSILSAAGSPLAPQDVRSEEHTSALQSLMRISYAVFCLKKKHQPHEN